MADDLPEVIGLPFFLFDGFADYHSREGTLRMTGYQISSSGERIPIATIGVTEAARNQLRERIISTLNQPDGLMNPASLGKPH